MEGYLGGIGILKIGKGTTGGGMLASWRDSQEAKSGMMYSGSNVYLRLLNHA